MDNLSVYKKMTTAPADLFTVIKQELGIKTNCTPFAVKAITELNKLGNLTESEAYFAANTFLANLQTLHQGGITPDDYDKIDFVIRGKAVTISARVEAFYRAAARKGYRITETIIAVPQDDSSTTYYKEHFHNGDFVYVLEDKRINSDREITAQRLVDGYFNKFLCRLEIVDIKSNKRIHMSVEELSNGELLKIAEASEQGLYKTEWQSYKDERGNARKRRVVTDKLNDTTFWVKWPGEMVKKSIIRRALKRLREVLPDLTNEIYAFVHDTSDYTPEETEVTNTAPPSLAIPMKETVNVNLHKLTKEQEDDVEETLELFIANPKLASDKAYEIKAMFERGIDKREIINTHYASIVNILKSAKLSPLIKDYIKSKPTEEKPTTEAISTGPIPEAPTQTEKPLASMPIPTASPTPYNKASTAAANALICTLCGREIINEKSKQYYAKFPNKEVICYNCNKGG